VTAGAERLLVFGCWRAGTQTQTQSHASGLWELGAARGRPKGRRGKKNDESDVHLPQRQKKSSYLLLLRFIFVFIFLSTFFKAFFGRFVTRGVQKHGKTFFSKTRKKSIWAHHKKCGF
jgi:hypothetical protein